MIQEKYQQNSIKRGFEKLLSQAYEQVLELDSEQNVAFPETGYYLPTIYGLLNEKITTSKQLMFFLKKLTREIYNDKEIDSNLQGLLALIFSEIIEVSKKKAEENSYSTYFSGFIPDTIFRKLGVPLVDGSIAGLGIIIGEVENKSILKELVNDFQRRNILTLYTGKICNQIIDAKIEIGLQTLVVPLGEELSSIAYAINLLIRIALAFGGIKPGNKKELLEYLNGKIPAFVLFLGKQSPIISAFSAGLKAAGIPFVCRDTINLTLESTRKIVEQCLATRDIKVVIENIPIPINYGFAYEGQTVRKPDTYIEFGGGKSLAFELLAIQPLDEINDGQIDVIGPDLKDIEEGSILPLALIVEVAGKKMQQDFEPVLERQIHHFINFGDGLWHNAQREILWIRISKEAFTKGFTLKHIGEILYCKIHSQFNSIVDKVQVKIYTTFDLVEKLLPNARERYLLRDNRLKNLSDESITTFYSCLLCQSFAPNHVCIISPERTGLCGAVNWLDAKTSYEINPSGGNQPVHIGELLEPNLGSWSGINQYVYKESHGTILEICLYSIMKNPLTSCGCFECIAAVIPEANGIMIVPREYSGDTPLGVSFSTLAGVVGGGNQTSGFIGIGKNFIISRKFLLAEGGIKRIVWMPIELKQFLFERIEEISPNFITKIADEKIATSLEKLLDFLNATSHPALKMDSIL
ncbi:MAG: CO dehydrogenase/CO-methylating acetyl-CoA synthase complex subunit beta [Candidatus Heimdallarchaeota archaeon]|nr:CO dehydrogenase/CO-methylating acetyl-CoA synthase complex subunit beta [Candidatus Heimdallarchaeota archaeon]